jgi:hypothetical protein
VNQFPEQALVDVRNVAFSSRDPLNLLSRLYDAYDLKSRLSQFDGQRQTKITETDDSYSCRTIVNLTM